MSFLAELKARASTNKSKNILPPGWEKKTNANGVVYYENLENSYTQRDPPTPLPKGWTTALDNERVLYYISPEGKSMWSLPPNVPRNASVPGAAAGCRNNTAKLQAEVQALRQKVAELQSAAPANTGRPSLAGLSNSPNVAKYRNMLKRGVPEMAVRQKMTLEGKDPSLLFGGPAASAAPAGRPAFLAGIAKGATGLRGANNTRKVPSAPKGPNMGSIAAEAAAFRSKLRPVANSPRPVKNNKPATGFAAFQKELANRVTQKNATKKNVINTPLMKMEKAQNTGVGGQGVLYTPASQLPREPEKKESARLTGITDASRNLGRPILEPAKRSNAEIYKELVTELEQLKAEQKKYNNSANEAEKMYGSAQRATATTRKGYTVANLQKGLNRFLASSGYKPNATPVAKAKNNWWGWD